MNRIVAVVVTCNRKEMLKQCVESLLLQTASCDVLIVDNASTDGTAEYLKTLKKNTRIHIISSRRNLGGAGGFNLGIRKAVECGYEYIWIMDDDTLPRPDALGKLLEADESLNGNYGFLSSVVLWTDGSGCKMNRQKVKKNFYENVGLLTKSLIPVEQATFVSLFIKTETVKKAGLPVKEFFIWGDDLEYTRRMAVRMKMPCYLVGRSQVVHAMRTNNGSCIATDAPERIDRYRYAYRNENFAYRYEGIKGIIYYIAKCFFNIFRIWIKGDSHRLRRSWIVLSQMFAGFRFNPKIETVSGGDGV
ncbi:MAG: glycosyltransferase family 2 protein [Lachnospiraceae bacterium]|nr:glycosyltransferase family 2 protein [Lachnospiraceae bacterium]